MRRQSTAGLLAGKYCVITYYSQQIVMVGILMQNNFKRGLIASLKFGRQLRKSKVDATLLQPCDHLINGILTLTVPQHTTYIWLACQSVLLTYDGAILVHQFSVKVQNMFRAPRALRAPRILRTPEHREHREHQNTKRRDHISSKLQNTYFLSILSERYLTSGNVIKTTFSLLPFLSFHTIKKFRDGQSSLYNTKQSNRSTLPLH